MPRLARKTRLISGSMVAYLYTYQLWKRSLGTSACAVFLQQNMRASDRMLSDWGW